MHYMRQKKGSMPKGVHMLYSKCKESQFNRWAEDQDQVHWVDWESTDEYDMDIDEEVAKMCGRLQERVMQFQSLASRQPPKEEVAVVGSQ